MIAMLAVVFSCSPKLSGQVVTRTITLNWDASATANVSGYRIYVGQASGVYPHVLDVGNSTTADVTNLIEGTVYYFAVSAYDVDGNESGLSEEFHYTPNPALLLNISTRAKVAPDDGALIAGFIVGGAGVKKTIIRALGPSLSAAGVAGALEDPMLDLYGPGGLIVSNDDWMDGNPEELASMNLQPANGVEGALVVRLKPGNYSVVVRGKNGGTGIALLEVFDGGN